MQNSYTLAGFRAPHLLAGLPAEAPVAVALSGGADSVSLLCLLCKHPNLFAVHVHHGIRGAEADHDLAFCESLTKKLGVPFHALFVDAPARAKTAGISLETAAREARYEAITAFLLENKIPLLATAHHADDQLETMLQHLLRGCGTRGLCGIPACRPLAEGVFVVRPLLTVPKADILTFLAAKGQDFVTDSTNEELGCQRNMLRHRVLPLLSALQPDAPAIAARCAEALAEDEAYLDGLAAAFISKAGSNLQADALANLPSPVFVRVMRRVLPEPATAKQLSAIRELLKTNRPHAALSLGGGAQLSLDRGTLAVTKERRTPAAPYHQPLKAGENLIDGANAAIYLLPIGSQPPESTANYRFTATANICSNAVVGTLHVRPRKAGDVIFHGRMHKAVRRLSDTAHLAPAVRARMPLLTDDAGVLAVPFGPVRDGAAKAPDLTVYFCFQ